MKKMSKAEKIKALCDNIIQFENDVYNLNTKRGDSKFPDAEIALVENLLWENGPDCGYEYSFVKDVAGKCWADRGILEIDDLIYEAERRNKPYRVIETIVSEWRELCCAVGGGAHIYCNDKLRDKLIEEWEAKKKKEA